MEVKIEMFDGVPLRVPTLPEFFWPGKTLAEIPTCCGPGPVGQVGDYLVPDVIKKLPVSAACWPHDFMFRYGSGRADFKLANDTFLHNMWSLNEYLGGDVHEKLERLPRIYAYYKAVSSPVGYLCFVNSKP